MPAHAAFVRRRVVDGVCEILMDHAPVNALSVPMLDELLAAFEHAATDDAVRAVVLGSTVPKRFCAGLDLKAFAKQDGDGVRALLERLYTRFTDLQHRLGKPSIAAVNGTARGGGMTLAISCDMAIVDADADLGYPEIDVGVIPAIHFAHLPRIIGRHRAFDLLFTGRAFGAREAVELGLAARIAEPGTALETAHEVARVLAAKPTRVLRMAREAFGREVDAGGGYRHGVATAVENFCNVAATPESKAGIRAFVDRPRRVVDREPR
ncbi:MAG: enoyl-CoA hydratase/isomerase family protein [Burkholderiales bacterium]